jgi:acyl carrier protein phosphodiesterase
MIYSSGDLIRIFTCLNTRFSVYSVRVYIFVVFLCGLCEFLKTMNFLAHLVLSPKETDYIAGNIAADFLKGSDRKFVSVGVQNGILMHRFVDQFTDTHVLVKTSKDRLKNHFRLLSGVLIDVFYDHFLAKNLELIANVSLEAFCDYIYITLEKNISHLPLRLQQFVPVMIRENILFSYRRLTGVQTALTIINLRITKKFSVGLAMAVLNDMYDLFENDFRQYFPCLINVTEHYRKDFGTFLLPDLIK